ncbi:MAG: endo-1,4-beta-xylanase [Pseudomonadota bacterium]
MRQAKNFSGQFFFFLAVLLALCPPAVQAAADPLPDPATAPALKTVFASHFLIGGAITPNTGNDPDQLALLRKHYNSVTAENIMKPEKMSIMEDMYSYGAADRMVEFAMKNEMKVRGHTLVWHQQTPNWFFEDDDGREVSAAILQGRLEKYVHDVVTHFKGKIYAWDVVNEVIDENESNGFRRSRWYKILGSDFIDIAFKAARAADPELKLFINDYSTEQSKKRAFLYSLVKQLKSKGVPVDGVGHQMHVSAWYPQPEEIAKTLRMFEELGVENHITELDVSLYNDPGSCFSNSNSCLRYASEAAIPAADLQRQARQYQDIFEVFLRFKSVTSVTFWGISDLNTWLTSWPVNRPNLPLLFDKSFQPKAAFWSVVDTAKAKK